MSVNVEGGANSRGRMIVYHVFTAADSGTPAFTYQAGRFTAGRVRAECTARDITGRVRVLWHRHNRWGMDLRVKEMDLPAIGGG